MKILTELWTHKGFGPGKSEIKDFLWDHIPQINSRIRYSNAEYIIDHIVYEYDKRVIIIVAHKIK